MDCIQVGSSYILGRTLRSSHFSWGSNRTRILLWSIFCTRKGRNRSQILGSPCTCHKFSCSHSRCTCRAHSPEGSSCIPRRKHRSKSPLGSNRSRSLFARIFGTRKGHNQIRTFDSPCIFRRISCKHPLSTCMGHILEDNWCIPRKKLCSNRH